jgi:hypothetical protein
MGFNSAFGGLMRGMNNVNYVRGKLPVSYLEPHECISHPAILGPL